MKRCGLLLACCLIVWSHMYGAGSISAYANRFVSGYRLLHIPELEYDYHDYFASIPSLERVQQQQQFFERERDSLTRYKRLTLAAAERVVYDHLLYEIDLNLERVKLETKWITNGRKTPEGGLHALADYRSWYAYFVKRYTTSIITPDEVYSMGEAEVKRVKKEITQLQSALGFKDSASFYNHLGREEFYITDKQQVIKGFGQIDSTVRKHLPQFIGTPGVPAVFAMEWPGAGASTPPGIYLNRSYNAYGKDVFQFSFYNRRYNKRAMEWLYMHEAIPGHHLQFSLQKQNTELQDLFLYPGNFEGWGCYVEYFGKELGLYKDPYSYLGKWEWDLVRSARLVIDAGIHYHGWTREQALNYWKATIPGQDEIAEREVTRVTNWPCQALSYKVGADRIFKMQTAWQHKNQDKAKKEFHRLFLSYGRVPLAVIEKNIAV